MAGAEIALWDRVGEGEDEGEGEGDGEGEPTPRAGAAEAREVVRGADGEASAVALSVGVA